MCESLSLLHFKEVAEAIEYGANVFLLFVFLRRVVGLLLTLFMLQCFFLVL